MDKILIIDDDRELCALIKRSVQSEHIEADFCNTGKEGLQKLKEQEYQLVVLDVMMPGMDGFETLEEIRKENSLPILMFTSKNDSVSKVRGLRAGADDYLPKPFEPLELVLRIKNILRRAPQEDGQAVEKLNLGLCCYDMVKKELLTKQGTVIHITPVEQAMLNVLGQKSGQIFTREKLAEILGAGQSPRAIDVQITRLRKKIEKDSKNPRYLQTVRGKGYMLLPE